MREANWLWAFYVGTFIIMVGWLTFLAWAILKGIDLVAKALA